MIKIFSLLWNNKISFFKIFLAVTLTSQLGLCQEDYYYDSPGGYQQQYYQPEYDQYHQSLLDRSYETNFKQNPRESYYQQPYEEEVEEENYPAQPFTYEYGGADSAGRHFAKTESKDEAGVVKGKYEVLYRGQPWANMFYY